MLRAHAGNGLYLRYLTTRSRIGGFIAVEAREGFSRQMKNFALYLR